MQRVHFIAIGGSAMHNLAIALSKKELFEVTGSDEEIYEPSYSRLKLNQLLPDKPGWFPEKIHENLDAVILGMSARSDNPELLKAKELGLKVFSMPEYLFLQTRNKTRIVVGGSHGKTTTTAMILHVMKKLNFKADYMIGTQLPGFEDTVHLTYDARVAVLEGDEYLSSALDKRSKFHHYKAHIAVLTGVAWDYVNVFPTEETYAETFSKFIDSMEVQGRLIYFEDDDTLSSIVKSSSRIDIVAFPYKTPKYEIRDGVAYVKNRKNWVKLQVFGEHNLQNLEAARLACRQVGIWDDKFYEAIADFTGVFNRLEKIAEQGNKIFFRDVAHTPARLKATIKAVREMYPGRKIIACLELRTYSSPAKNFLPHYGGTMEDADVAMICYKPEMLKLKKLKPITPEEVEEAFGGDNLTVYPGAEEFEKELKELDFENSVLLMMTSGDFTGINMNRLGKQLIAGDE